MLEIRNLTKEKIRRKKLEAVAGIAFKAVGLGKNTEVSLVFCGDKKMKDLNSLYRKKDRTTDVLSFSAREAAPGQKPFILPEIGEYFLGEIFISLAEARRQSLEYGESLDGVLAKLLIHGILHLTGYDHEKNETGAKKMFALQEEIYNKL